MLDRTQTATLDPDGQPRRIVQTLEPCTRMSQGSDHPVHRPTAQRLIPVEDGRDRQPGDQAGEDARCRTAVTAIDGPSGGDEAGGTAQHGLVRRRAICQVDPEVPQSSGGRCHVGTRRQPADAAGPRRQRCQHQDAMRYRLVTRDAD